jgi:hypothetical protein
MKKRISKLTLKRETIADLDLQKGRVAGGESELCPTTWYTVTCPTGQPGTQSKGPSCAPSGCTQQN